MKLNRMVAVAVLLLGAFSISAVAQMRWGQPDMPRTGACFFRDSEFRGDYFCMRAGDRESSLPRGFSDQISSIRVFGDARVRVFNDVNFGGVNTRFDNNVRDLARVPVPDNRRKNWNDRISSIAVFSDRDDQWKGPHRR